jgi:hypothetical protein
MIMIPTELGSKNDCAGRGQQQLTRSAVLEKYQLRYRSRKELTNPLKTTTLADFYFYHLIYVPTVSIKPATHRKLICEVLRRRSLFSICNKGPGFGPKLSPRKRI